MVGPSARRSGTVLLANTYQINIPTGAGSRARGNAQGKGEGERGPLPGSKRTREERERPCATSVSRRHGGFALRDPCKRGVATAG